MNRKQNPLFVPDNPAIAIPPRRHDPNCICAACCDARHKKPTGIEAGKRYLFKLRSGGLFEGAVVELSPSLKFARLTNIRGEDHWLDAADLNAVEELANGKANQ